jgi:2-methylcitrate dehydratase PrpD
MQACHAKKAYEVDIRINAIRCLNSEDLLDSAPPLSIAVAYAVFTNY